MKPILLAIAFAALSSSAYAYDDDMMGTMINGRMESRNERSVRVPDPEMDREEMIIDREKRQGRNTVEVEADERTQREPFQGKLPD